MLDLIERGRAADCPTTAAPVPALGDLHMDRPAAELSQLIFTISPFVGVFNVTGGPALSLPWGLDSTGLPIGIHLAGHPGADHDVVRRLPPWRRPVPTASTSRGVPGSA